MISNKPVVLTFTLISEFLDVFCFYNLLTPDYRRLCKLLPFAQFFQDASFFEFSLELFQCSVNVFTFLDRYDNHVYLFLDYISLFSLFTKSGCKITNRFSINQRKTKKSLHLILLPGNKLRDKLLDRIYFRFMTGLKEVN